MGGIHSRSVSKSCIKLTKYLCFLDQLCGECKTSQEKLIIWTLLETGLRVSELCSITQENILWQQKSIRITGKGGIHGKKSKKRVVPMSPRVQALLEHYFAINDKWPVGLRQVQKIVKEIANRAKLTKAVTPHILIPWNRNIEGDNV